MNSPEWLNKIKWNEAGLVPVIVQENSTQKVLMHAWMNAEALQQTVKKGLAVFWSRSRQSLWTKGETSGHTQQVKGIFLDCDGDTLLLSVEQNEGIACHTGRESCFYSKLENEQWQIVEDVIKDPKQIYR